LGEFLNISIPLSATIQNGVVDEIYAALFDERQLDRSYDDYLEMFELFLEYEFFMRKFGSQEASILGSSELRRFIGNSIKEN
jgi:hypothetical protein